MRWLIYINYKPFKSDICRTDKMIDEIEMAGHEKGQ